MKLLWQLVYLMLSLVLFDTIVALYENNAYSFAQADEVNNARRGLYTVAQDMREMTYGEDGTFSCCDNGA